MRAVVSLLLIVVVAFAGTAEVHAMYDAETPAPMETHAPSDLAEESEVEELVVRQDAFAMQTLQPVKADVLGTAPSMTRAIPPTPPPR